jgi:hypothetical protein
MAPYKAPASFKETMHGVGLDCFTEIGLIGETVEPDGVVCLEASPRGVEPFDPVVSVERCHLIAGESNQCRSSQERRQRGDLVSIARHRVEVRHRMSPIGLRLPGANATSAQPDSETRED